MNTALPDLAGFVLNKTVENIDFEGVAVPGLDGWFYRRQEDDGKVASVGVYTFDDREVFRAWGFVGESHCRASALRLPDGGWEGPHGDCPEVRVHRRGRAVIGFSVRVGDAEPRYFLIGGGRGEPGPARYAHASGLHVRLPPARVPPHTGADGSASAGSMEGLAPPAAKAPSGVSARSR